MTRAPPFKVRTSGAVQLEVAQVPSTEEYEVLMYELTKNRL